MPKDREKAAVLYITTMRNYRAAGNDQKARKAADSVGFLDFGYFLKPGLVLELEEKMRPDTPADTLLEQAKQLSRANDLKNAGENEESMPS